MLLICATCAFSFARPLCFSLAFDIRSEQPLLFCKCLPSTPTPLAKEKTYPYHQRKGQTALRAVQCAEGTKKLDIMNAAEQNLAEESRESKEASATYAAAAAESRELERKLQDPEQRKSYRLLTGDRPTGRLHIGHYFGSLSNRVAMQELGLETFIVIADYQVLTDRVRGEDIAYFTRQLCIDYLAVGLDPENYPVHIFVHSQVPELNQLFVPFLTLVSQRELERNPTTKDEMQHSSLEQFTASLLTYPVHQAADILFCHGNVVPVGKDQLPHIELTRNIARRFNRQYSPQQAYFPRPTGLLSEAPAIMGLDASAKMSKSRGNSIALSASADEVAKAIKKATTDSERRITYEPQRRPALANLLLLASLCSGTTAESIAEGIGDAGAGVLKKLLTEALNATLEPIRQRRKELAKNEDYIDQILLCGSATACEYAERTIRQVHELMGIYPSKLRVK